MKYTCRSSHMIFKIDTLIDFESRVQVLDIVIFAWRVIWRYAYSPFNPVGVEWFILAPWKGTRFPLPVLGCKKCSDFQSTLNVQPESLEFKCVGLTRQSGLANVFGFSKHAICFQSRGAKILWKCAYRQALCCYSRIALRTRVLECRGTRRPVAGCNLNCWNFVGWLFWIPFKER